MIDAWANQQRSFAQRIDPAYNCGSVLQHRIYNSCKKILATADSDVNTPIIPMGLVQFISTPIPAELADRLDSSAAKFEWSEALAYLLMGYGQTAEGCLS